MYWFQNEYSLTMIRRQLQLGSVLARTSLTRRWLSVNQTDTLDDLVSWDVVNPKWGQTFFKRAAFALTKYGMYYEEDMFEESSGIVDNMRFELEDLIGDSVSMWRDFDPAKDAQDAAQLTALMKSVVLQFPNEINQRVANAQLDETKFTVTTAQLFGDAVPDDYAVDNQAPEQDPRKLAVVFFMNPAWKQSSGGHWRFQLPKSAKNILSHVVEPKAGTILLYWADTSKFQVLPYHAPEESKLLSLHVWLHAASQESVGKPVDPALLQAEEW
jgi:hypothetical protein